MTGAFVRVKRGEKWENVEVEHLTDEELHEKFATREPQELISWMVMLCSKIRQCQTLFDELVRDGILEFRRGDEETTDTESCQQ